MNGFELGIVAEKVGLTVRLVTPPNAMHEERNDKRKSPFISPTCGDDTWNVLTVADVEMFHIHPICSVIPGGEPAAKCAKLRY